MHRDTRRSLESTLSIKHFSAACQSGCSRMNLSNFANVGYPFDEHR